VATTVISPEFVRIDEPLNFTERAAIAGFLAGHSGNTLVSYTTDLRLFAEWWKSNDLRLMEVRRAHLEIFGRTMEADGRMRSTVARRLSTLGSLLPVLPRRRNPRTRPRRDCPASQGRRRITHPRP
jgi:integrase/recombinase XerD